MTFDVLFVQIILNRTMCKQKNKILQHEYIIKIYAVNFVY